jgi:Asp-tRNA(Asn)/Glu-tRNA(Gln) amidotransferase C subunit
MTKATKRKKARRILELLALKKECVENVDKELSSLMGGVEIGEEIEVDGVAYAVADNFADSNHVWRGKRVCRFELQKLPKKKD